MWSGAGGTRAGTRTGPDSESAGLLAARGEDPGYTPRHLAEKILTTRSALEGERRQVTVLFADVANFTTLAAQLAPEDVHQVIDGCFERITAEVHQFEGRSTSTPAMG